MAALLSVLESHPAPKAAGGERAAVQLGLLLMSLVIKTLYTPNRTSNTDEGKIGHADTS